MGAPQRLAAAPLSRVKSGDGEEKKTPNKDIDEISLVLSRLKNFVKVPSCTGFCVDAENAAV